MPLPLTSVRPPPGMAIEAPKVAGLVEGHVTRSAVILRSVNASVVAGETARSSNEAVPLVKSKRSRLIRHAGAPGGGGLSGFAVGGGGAAAGAPALAGAALISSSRSILPAASRTARASTPSMAMLPSATVRAIMSACFKPTVSFGTVRKGVD